MTADPPFVTARECAAAAAQALRHAESAAPAADADTVRWLVDAGRVWTDLAVAIARQPQLGPPPPDGE